jgi:sulfate permease, SulP family
VMDRLAGTEFLAHLSGGVHLSQHQAMQAINKPPVAAA